MSNLFNFLQEYIEIANMFKNNIQVSLFLKHYALSKVEEMLRYNPAALTQEEHNAYTFYWADFSNQIKQYNITTVLTKEAYTEFLDQSFNNINLETATQNTLITAKNLIDALHYFGPVSTKYVQIMNYVINRLRNIAESSGSMSSPEVMKSIMTFDEKKQLFEGKSGSSNTNTNMNMNMNKQQINTNVNVNNEGNFKKTVKSEDFPLPRDVSEILPKVKKTDEDIMKRINQDINAIPRFVDKAIPLPMNTKSREYSRLKETILTHIEHAGLELEFNKLDYSINHIEAAIYYLRNLNN